MLGPALFVSGVLGLIVIAGVVIFWPRRRRERDSTFVDHSDFDYDERSNEQTHASSSHDGPHDS